MNLEIQKNIQMEQKKKKQVCHEGPHHKGAALKGLVEMLTTTTNRFQLSMSEEDMIACLKRTIDEVMTVRGIKYSSWGLADEEINTLLARFLLTKDYHTGFMFWGKSGTGKTIRLKSVYLLIQYFFGSIPELGCSVQYKTANDLVYPYATIESFNKLSVEDLLILDNLGYERCAGENIQLHSLSLANCYSNAMMQCFRLLFLLYSILKISVKFMVRGLLLSYVRAIM